jgi:2,4-dienoyl-CoA reductase-like NADH-dependent reductase (Old Yellow Enzyme family)
MSKLLSPIQLGDLSLKNRVVMAPLTRGRADYQRVPNDLMVEYYAQRTSMGMIITEATSVDPLGVGYPRTPGIWNDAQVKAWRKITDAVHEKGGTIVLQLWHVGRLSDPIYLDGKVALGPSAIAADATISLVRPEKKYGIPQEMSVVDIKQAIDAFKRGAENAKKAGFDGVEIHGANGYLLDQFLQTISNVRTDQYGGSLQNRARFALEVVDAVAAVWGAGRVGYHLSPRCDILGMGDANPLETFSYLVSELSKRGLAFICSREHEAADSLNPKLRPLFKGGYIVNEGFTKASGEQAIERGVADAVAFGKITIPNPDLVEKFKTGQALKDFDMSTFYNDHAHLFDLAEPLPERGFYDSDRRGYVI